MLNGRYYRLLCSSRARQQILSCDCAGDLLNRLEPGLDRLEAGSTASPIKQLLETHSTAGSIVHRCYPALESGSTAVAGVRLNGGYKSTALQFNSFERREDTPDRISNLT